MIEHGTPHGFHQGCKTRVGCPAVIPCREVYIRYRSDLTFKKALDSGVSLEGILEADEAAARADADAVKEARRAERRAMLAPRPKPKVKRRYVRRDSWTVEDQARMLECIAADMTVTQAAEAMRKGTDKLRAKAAEAGVEFRGRRVSTRIRTPGGASGVIRRAWTADDDAALLAAHAEGLSIGEAEVRVGRSRTSIRFNAERLGVEFPRRPKGYTDRRPTYARRNAAPRQVKPHGTNASYSRGCHKREDCPNFDTDQPTCADANRDYMRAYVARRKAAGVPAEKHGTAYGYQLGCVAGSECPASPTCAEAAAGAERARARAAGVEPVEPMVDAGPVREHIRDLMRSMSLLAIADAAGVHRSQLGNLIYGRSGEKGRSGAPRQLRVSASRAERIMAVKP